MKKKFCSIHQMVVKTIYNITITEEDMKLIIIKMKTISKDYLELLKVPIAADLEDLQPDYEGAEWLFEHIWPLTPDGTLSYIVCDLMGFDGIENFGCYDDDNKVATLQVYCYGDQINGRLTE